MLPFSVNIHNILSIFLVVILHVQPCILARPTPTTLITKTNHTNNENYYYTWQNFLHFLNAKRGSHINGMSELKKYFRHFGYLPIRDFQNLTDSFDAHFEAAVVRYQSRFGLQVTGQLDDDTLTQIMSPRCGVSDESFHALHASRNFVYFPGKPRWARQVPMSLTYAFSPENLIHYVSLWDLKAVFKRAFGRWESVIPVTFIEASDYEFADIKIGFYSGDHGDGEAFDGVLGVLAHSFSPESGRFHLDAAETWAVDFDVEKSKVAVDLESVAVHEIGHLLGLAHSPVKEAVMYPSLKPRRKKVELSVDDIQGVQALYGSNPNFTFGSLLESDISSNHAVDFRIIRPYRKWVTLILMVTNFILGLCS